MSASLKLHQLESKLSDLQSKYQDLLKQRQQEIALLISTIDLAHLDDKTMIGGLLFLKNKITIQDPILESWHDAGEKFLHPLDRSLILDPNLTKGISSQEDLLKFQIKHTHLPNQIRYLRQQLNRLKNHLVREKNKVKQQCHVPNRPNNFNETSLEKWTAAWKSCPEAKRN